MEGVGEGGEEEEQSMDNQLLTTSPGNAAKLGRHYSSQRVAVGTTI